MSKRLDILHGFKNRLQVRPNSYWGIWAVLFVFMSDGTIENRKINAFDVFSEAISKFLYLELFHGSMRGTEYLTTCTKSLDLSIKDSYSHQGSKIWCSICRMEHVGWKKCNFFIDVLMWSEKNDFLIDPTGRKMVS